MVQLFSLVESFVFFLLTAIVCTGLVSNYRRSKSQCQPPTDDRCKAERYVSYIFPYEKACICYDRRGNKEILETTCAVVQVGSVDLEKTLGSAAQALENTNAHPTENAVQFALTEAL